MDWARILAYVMGTVDQELLARNEYLAIGNRTRKAQLNGRPKLSDAEAQIAPAHGSAATRANPHRYAGRHKINSLHIAWTFEILSTQRCRRTKGGKEEKGPLI